MCIFYTIFSIELIDINNIITIKELSEKIGISDRSIERNIKKLQDQGLLKRVGASKGGYWKILKKLKNKTKKYNGHLQK